jgi:hypothetical protein
VNNSPDINWSSLLNGSSWTLPDGYISSILAATPMPAITKKPVVPRAKLHTDYRVASELTLVPCVSRAVMTDNCDENWKNDRPFYLALNAVNYKRLKNHAESFYDSSTQEYELVLRMAVEFFLDCGCVEVSHTPTDCLVALETLYKAIYYAAEKEKLVAQFKEETETEIKYHPTGGGHIHCDLPYHYFSEEKFFEHARLFEENLIVSCINNPYLLWLFRNPFNNDIYNFYNGTQMLPIDYKTLLISQRPLIPRYRITRYRTRLPTIEFRLFDAPVDVNQAILQARFVRHWMGYIGQLTTKDVKLTIDISPEKYKKFTRNITFVRAALKELCYNMHFEDYVPQLECYFENYRVRRESGKFV